MEMKNMGNSDTNSAIDQRNGLEYLQALCSFYKKPTPEQKRNMLIMVTESVEESSSKSSVSSNSSNVLLLDIENFEPLNNPSVR
jgi:hypothetical protein